MLKAAGWLAEISGQAVRRRLASLPNLKLKRTIL